MGSSTPWALTWYDMIFYTNVQHSPTKTIQSIIKTHTHTHYKHTHNDCSWNRVLILVFFLQLFLFFFPSFLLSWLYRAQELCKGRGGRSWLSGRTGRQSVDVTLTELTGVIDRVGGHGFYRRYVHYLHWQICTVISQGKDWLRLNRWAMLSGKPGESVGGVGNRVSRRWPPTTDMA